MSKNVIVFGPTGSVGAIAAQTAQEHGAKVFLAMRDPQKTIRGLSPEKEKAGGFERVQADLTQPETVKAAVQQSGAKHAYIYVIHTSPDHMKSTIETLKAGGVELVVLLSSFTVTEPIDAIPREEVIPYMHAQVELNLREVYGEGNFVALRPGGFATNSLRWKHGFKSAELKMYGSHFKQDVITPDDMGRVAGTILAKGPQDGQHIVYLYGPKRQSQRDMALIVAKVLGIDLKITQQTPEQARAMYEAGGIPPPVINYMLKRLSDDQTEALTPARYEEGIENIKKYTGRESLGFEQWVSENKDLYE